MRGRQANYTDYLTDALQDSASGDIGPSVESLGAVEIAAGLWSRAFASALVTPSTMATGALTPSLMANVGRELAVRGECVYLIDVDRNGVTLTPAANWEVQGSADPSTWIYTLDLAGPSAITTRVVPSAKVLHPKYAVRPGEPWRGLSPLGAASKTQRLAACLEANLGNEAATTTGYVLALPENHNSVKLIPTFKTMNGKLYIADSVASTWGAVAGRQPPKEWATTRVGADPPAAHWES